MAGTCRDDLGAPHTRNAGAGSSTRPAHVHTRAGRRSRAAAGAPAVAARAMQCPPATRRRGLAGRRVRTAYRETSLAMSGLRRGRRPPADGRLRGRRFPRPPRRSRAGSSRRSADIAWRSRRARRRSTPDRRAARHGVRETGLQTALGEWSRGQIYRTAALASPALAPWFGLSPPGLRNADRSPSIRCRPECAERGGR